MNPPADPLSVWILLIDSRVDRVEKTLLDILRREITGLYVEMDKEDVDKHYSFDWQGIRFEMHYQIT